MRFWKWFSLAPFILFGMAQIIYFPLLTDNIKDTLWKRILLEFAQIHSLYINEMLDSISILSWLLEKQQTEHK